jgi:hypothetical protein
MSTDANGAFRFTNLAVGKYVVYAAVETNAISTWAAYSIPVSVEPGRGVEHIRVTAKPLDAKAFWRGRVIWLDDSATDATHSRGRSYPPIPYPDPGVPRSPGDTNDLPPSGGGVPLQGKQLGTQILGQVPQDPSRSAE